MSSLFHFKHFSVKQDQCAMKIGTDGVLLGAWVNLETNINNVLDIGAGTGVISLMLAQRFSNVEIEAIEIDEKAYEQAVENFENSLWGDRLFCYHASFQEYFQEVDDEKYDLIISNPPFYLATQKTKDESRNKARFQDALPFEHLFYGASKLLSEEGVFAIILPFDKEEEAITIAKQMNLYPSKITRVKGNISSSIKRSLLQFQFEKKEVQQDELVLEEERNKYTVEYEKLVKDFYLKL